MQNDPSYFIIHTAAHEGTDYDIEDIDQWHRNRGFNMVGYHFFVLKDGAVQQGRPTDLHGAHCIDNGMNTRSLGISFQGHGDKSDFTQAQKSSLTDLYQNLGDKHGIPVENVHGHRRHCDTKSCPGTEVSMEGLRSLLATAPPSDRASRLDAANTEPLDTSSVSDHIPNSL